MVSEEKLLQPLIPLIYDAALDSVRWNEALRRMSDALSYDSGFTSWSIANGSPWNRNYAIYAYWGQGPTTGSEYIQHFAKLFPYRPALQRLAPGEVYSDDQLLRRELLIRGEYFNEWLRPRGMHLMAGVLVAATTHETTNVDFQRNNGRHPITALDLRRLKVLAPHIRRALEFNRRFLSGQRHSRTLMGVLSLLTIGAALLDREGRLLFANAEAERLMNVPGGQLATKDGRMVVTPLENQPRFKALVQSAADMAEGAGFGGGGTLRVGSSKDTALTLQVTPVNAQSPASPVHWPQARVAVLMSTPSRNRAAIDLIRAAYGLSAAEARVAIALADGDSLFDIAERLGLSKITLRNQTQAVLAKTGTRNQSGLARLMAAHPAVMVNAASPLSGSH